MSLDSAYLEYGQRRYGMDHDLYDWRAPAARPRVSWPKGRPLALWITVALESHPLNPQGKPFKATGAMATPYPDLRHYSSRDYGARVGVYRLLRLFDELGLRVSWAVNARSAERWPGLVRAILDRGDEIVGHGDDMDRLLYAGLDEAEENALIADSLAALRAVSGQAVEGWVSPARCESPRTPELLARNGVNWFADWPNDDLPYEFRTPAGPLLALPRAADMDDRHLMLDMRQSPSEFLAQIDAQARRLGREAGLDDGRILSLSLTPWLAGQPHRIGALREALRRWTASGDVWSATGGDIVSAWKDAKASA